MILYGDNMEEEVRKCYVCKEFIYIEKDDIDTFIIDNNKYIHTKCFIQHKTNLKKGAWSIEKCEQKINELHDYTQQEVSNRIKRKKLTDWIFKTYNISYMPQYFYTKLESIYNGTYKGLSKSVPPEDLLDMWQRKINYLDKVNQKNKMNGKVMDNSIRINYDLAILLNKYDSYLEWKQEQQIIKNDIQNSINENKGKIDYNNIAANRQIQNNKDDKNIDIDKILDEI